MNLHHHSRRLLAVAAGTCLAIGFLPAGAQAGSVPTCDIVADPTDVVVAADQINDPDPVATLSYTFAGQWHLWPNASYWFRIGDAEWLQTAATFNGEDPISDGSYEIPLPVEAFIGTLGTFSITPEEGETYVFTIAFSKEETTPFDAANMQCTQSISFTYYETTPLPETGSDASVVALWAAALLGLGAATTLGISRRRA